VRVARDQQLRQPPFDGRQRGRDRVGLGREGGVLGGQLARGLQVGTRLLQLARRLVQRGERGETPPHPPGRGLVGVDGRVGEPLLQLRVLVQQAAEAIGAHVRTPRVR
jgi:hypothetical protein